MVLDVTVAKSSNYARSCIPSQFLVLIFLILHNHSIIFTRTRTRLVGGGPFEGSVSRPVQLLLGYWAAKTTLEGGGGVHSLVLILTKSTMGGRRRRKTSFFGCSRPGRPELTSTYRQAGPLAGPSPKSWLSDFCRDHEWPPLHVGHRTGLCRLRCR